MGVSAASHPAPWGPLHYRLLCLLARPDAGLWAELPAPLVLQRVVWVPLNRASFQRAEGTSTQPLNQFVYEAAGLGGRVCAPRNGRWHQRPRQVELGVRSARQAPLGAGSAGPTRSCPSYSSTHSPFTKLRHSPCQPAPLPPDYPQMLPPADPTSLHKDPVPLAGLLVESFLATMHPHPCCAVSGRICPVPC